MAVPTSQPLDASFLQDAYPHWAIWRSDAGYWYATRRAQIPLDAIKRESAMTVEATTAEELHAKLTAQPGIARPPMCDDIAAARRWLLAELDRWMVWYGEHTESWWGLPLWVEACRELIEAPTPAQLVERAREVERRHPAATWF